MNAEKIHQAIQASRASDRVTLWIWTHVDPEPEVWESMPENCLDMAAEIVRDRRAVRALLWAPLAAQTSDWFWLPR